MRPWRPAPGIDVPARLASRGQGNLLRLLERSALVNTLFAGAPTAHANGQNCSAETLELEGFAWDRL